MTDLGSNLDEPAAPAPRIQKAKQTPVGMPKTVKIILEEHDDIPPGGLFLGHNGRGYNIIPGEPVDVPDFLIEILDNAKVAAPITDPSTKQVTGWRERLRFGYRRL